MKIIQKFVEKQTDLHQSRQPVIAFLGDSVTQGCFEIYSDKDRVETVFSGEDGYVAKLKHIFGLLFPSVPLTIINAGISGQNAELGLERLSRDVLSYKPDLVVVCFGLNDAAEGEERLPAYLNSLREIMTQIQKSGAEVIFMTPNTWGDYEDFRSPNPVIERCIRQICEFEKAGLLRLYINAARDLCAKLGVPVCDCNAQWETLRAQGVDTNRLLSNQVNHPVREMHWLFAYELVRTIFEH